MILDGFDEAKFDNVFDLLPKFGCGAYLFTTDTSKFPILDKVFEIPKFLALDERKGLQTQLSNAIEIKDTENALRMISLGADANSTTSIGWPCISLTRLMLQNGAQPLLQDGNHHMPLDVAISLGKEDVVSELLKLEIQDSAVREEYLSKAFCSAIVRGHSKRDMALLLLQTGANVNVIIKDGRTSLIRSIECSEVSMARLLVRNGARANIPDANGDFPLTLAAPKGYHLLVRDIVRIRKAPDMKNSSGATALCIAAARGHKDVIQVLLDGRADKHLPNKYGEIALDLAEESRHKEIVKLLKSH